MKHAAEIYVHTGNSLMLYGVIKTRRSTKSYLRQWFYGICLHYQDNDPAQVGSTWFSVINRAGERKSFTNWHIYNDYSLLQALIGKRTYGKPDADTWCVEHEYYGDEWCTYYRIREVK